MPPPATADEFVDLVRKSGVADEAKLTATLAKWTADGTYPPDPAQLSGLLVRDGLITYFQADQLLQGKWKRFFIGKYKVLERLGGGGMGQVFLCEHKLMRRRVALKVLPAAKAADPAALERFYREARAVAALDHPNITRAYDIDRDESLHFLVMEYVDGTNLQDLVRKAGPLDVVRACHYVYGTAVGLQHAHEMGLVHRDVKPGNILIDRAGVVKLLDLGLARFFAADDDDQITQKYDESVLGTADYLAPEQAADSHAVDIRADIYSLGGTFYFLLTGKPPFADGTVPQKLLWHQSKAPPPVRSLRPEVPAELAAVVERMLAKEPAARYQTPAEVLAALAGWVQTPIPPPAEHELPRMSLAAAGPAGGSSTRGVGTSLSSFGDSHFHRPPSSAGDTKVTPRPAVLPVTLPAAGVWDTLGDDAGAVTIPPARKSAVAVRPPAPPRRRALPLAVAGGVLLLAVGVAGFLLVPSARTVPTADTGPKRWYVAKAGTSPDAARTVPSLKAALDAAGPGDAVVILDDVIDDKPIRLVGRAVGKNGYKGLSVEAGNAAKSVTWAVRAGGDVARWASALELQDVDSVRVSGITFDLAEAAEHAVSVAGTASGVQLVGLTVTDPKTAGFKFQAAAADPARPLVLSKFRVTGKAKYDAGVLLAAPDRLTNRAVHVIDGRVEGPAVAGVRVDGPASDVVVRNNRVWAVDVGVQVTGKVPDAMAFGLTVERNTFHSLGRGGLAFDVPLAGPKHAATLWRNYFAATAEVLVGPPPAGLRASENFRDPASKPGTALPDAVTEAAVALPANPSDAGFLLLPPGGPLGEIGAR